MLKQDKLIFRQDLQGLRGIAILLVILDHTELDFVRGGFVGVDVFFVLSGYFISGLLLSEIEQNSHIAFMRFYARRLKRLLPALIAMLVVSFGIAIYFLSGTEARTQLASLPFALTWTSNLYFAFKAVDYFDELANRDLFLHTWSLGVEEQFYLIWPVFLSFLFWSSKAQRKASQGIFSLILLGLFIAFFASLAVSLYWTNNQPHAAFYLMPSRIWQLSLGAIIYYILSKDLAQNNRLSQLFNGSYSLLTSITGSILIIGSAITLHPSIGYPGLWALVPSLGATLIIIAGHSLPERNNDPLSHTVLVWLGNRSYSLYLWHWPFFILGFSAGFQGEIIPTIGMILLSLLAAILSYRLIELPFWKGRWSHTTPTHIIFTSFLTVGTIVPAMLYGVNHFPFTDTATDLSNQWRMDLPKIYRLQCDTWYADSKVGECVFGKETATKTVVLLGDSIGAQWFSALQEIYPEPIWRIVVLTKSACALVDEDFYYDKIGKIYQVCTDWRNAVLNKLDNMSPDVLIMGNAATYNFSEEQWIEGSSRVLERVSETVETIFLIPGTPSLGFDGPGCLSRHSFPTKRISREDCLSKDRIRRIESTVRLLSFAADHFPNVHILNLNDLVCAEGNCNAVNENGLVVFRDSQHLTDSFVRELAPLIRKRINGLQSK